VRLPRVRFPAHHKTGISSGLGDVMGDWRDHAACRGMDTNLWFPEGRGQAVEAKAVCARCPVAGECRRDAEVHDAVGVWGGMTRAERHQTQDSPA
jgi:WhiB family redox-sensing transcriptional regulator